MLDDTDRYFGDLETGEEFDCGSIEIRRAEMLEFAERYDPHPYHIDEEAAAESMYGDLTASGFLTCSLTMRLLATGFLEDVRVLAARGIDDLRWPLPVYAGDKLSVRTKLVETHAGENPEFGHAKATVTTTNQHDEAVLTMTALVIVEKRSGA